MHSIACVWLLIGENIHNSWISYYIQNGFQLPDRSAKYITSLYWTVTTLATVGYGDVKGRTTIEYVFNMFVEFIGIAFFSYAMSSVQSILLKDNGSYDIMQTKLEQVDIWLVKLDNSRTSKSLPKILYDKIKLYIKESLLNDHKKLIEGYDFLH